jgi:hypothetical protein
MQTDGIQKKALSAKMLHTITALAEMIGDGDEAVDSYNRKPSEQDHRDGFEYCAPAYLSFYSSTGTGNAWQDKLIERHEEAQAAEWATQHPDRPSLFDVAADDDSSLQSEAHEWLDAALQGEAIYLSLEIESTDGDVIIRAEFTDEINAPYTSYVVTLDADEFMVMDDARLDKLLTEMADKVYEKQD